jgi:hypothetical protein
MVEIQWHSQTKARATANTNFNLHRRASPRPYLREALGEISGACSPDLTIGRAIAIRYDTEMLAVKADGESAGLVSEWGGREGDRFDAQHMQKFWCARDLGNAMCTKRQHTRADHI